MAVNEPLNIYTVTFNCARTLVDVDAFAAYLFRPNNTLPDIVVLSLQEIAPFAQSFLGGVFLEPFLARFSLAVQRAGSTVKYRRLVTHNVGMIAIMIMLKENLPLAIREIQTAEAGVGLWEMGNKGAAGVRLRFQPDNTDKAAAELTFVAAHLAPMEDGLQRRNQDWESIVRRLAFKSGNNSATRPSQSDISEHIEEDEPLLGKSSGESPMFVPHSPVIVAGDLNYRTSDKGPDASDAASFPQPVPDTKDPKHFSHLLQYDQLTRERRAGRTLHLLDEEPVEFPPTYKYSKAAQNVATDILVRDGGEPETYEWSTHRFPSWCDRILFSSYLTSSYSNSSSSPFTVQAYKALPLQPTSDHRPVGLEFKLDISSADFSSSKSEQTPPFPLDPRWESRRAFARRLEIGAGVVTYLTWTWEGNLMLFGTIMGILGGWWIISTVTRP